MMKKESDLQYFDSTSTSKCKDKLSPWCYEAELTAAPVRVAEFDVTAGAGRILPGSLRSEQVINLCVQ